MKTKPTYDVHYANGRTSLVMEADLDIGWGKRDDTFGFFGQKWIPYRRDSKIRTQLSLKAHSDSFVEWAQQFPDRYLERGNAAVNYKIHAKQLVVSVALSAEQPWQLTKDGGRPCLYLEELAFVALDSAHWCDLRGLIVFHESPRCPIPDVRVWAENKLILPGHFESSRRRH